MSDLPPGWEWTSIGDIAATSLGKMLDKNQATGLHPTPYLRNINVRWGSFDLSDLAEMDIRPEELDRVLAQPGDVIACEGGEPGRAAVWRGPGTIALQKALHRVQPTDAILPDYLAHLLQHLAMSRALEPLFTGTTIKHLPQEKLRLVPVPLSPRAEQERIVAAIEEHLSRLDATDAILDAVGRKVARLREVLDYQLISGLGRADDRGAPGRSPEELIAEAAYLRAAMLREGRFRLAYNPDQQPSDPTPIPRGWVWSSIGAIADRVTVGHVGPTEGRYRDQGIPFLRSMNVRANRFESQGLAHIEPDFHEQLRKSALVPGDVVIVRSGAVGTACVVPEGIGEANCADLVVVKQPRAVRPEWLARYMNSVARSHVAAGKVGVALEHFNTKSVAALPIPVPPEAVQRKILEQLSAWESVITRLEDVAASSKARSQSVRSAVLAAAFSGLIVPQDPDDEPASALLDRIRAEREAATPAMRSRKARAS